MDLKRRIPVQNTIFEAKIDMLIIIHIVLMRKHISFQNYHHFTIQKAKVHKTENFSLVIFGRFFT